MRTQRSEALAVSIPQPRVHRILLADDDREMRAVVASILRHDGYEVVEAVDGVEMLAHLVLAERLPELRRSIASALCGDDGGALESDTGRALVTTPGPTSFTAIVASLETPGLSGLDVLSLLGCTGCTVPMILIASLADDATQSEARALGAAAVFGRPLDIDTLLAATRATAHRRPAA